MEKFEPKVYISEKFMKIVRELDREFDTEFSVLGKAEIDGDVYKVGDEYYIPEQEVSHSSVDYIEDMFSLREQGWNVVVHKHPSGINSFSEPDYEYLNNQFPLSLLWVNQKFNDGTVLLHIGDKYLVIDVDVRNIHIGTEEHIEIEGIAKIKKRTYKYTYKKTDKKDKTENDIIEMPPYGTPEFDDYLDRIYDKYKEKYGDIYG